MTVICRWERMMVKRLGWVSASIFVSMLGGACESASSGGFGDPCQDGSDCASGVCEGPGCDGVTPGTCTSASEPVICEAIAQEYCGCDGTTFTGGGFYFSDAPDTRCAGGRYARVGACASDGGTDGGLPEGATCGAADECLSGVCEGEGCGEAAGTCVTVPRDCTADVQEYCGCDGVTFTSSGSCPGQLYARRGPC